MSSLQKGAHPQAGPGKHGVQISGFICLTEQSLSRNPPPGSGIFHSLCSLILLLAVFSPWLSRGFQRLEGNWSALLTECSGPPNMPPAQETEERHLLWCRCVSGLSQGSSLDCSCGACLRLAPWRGLKRYRVQRSPEQNL